MEVWRIEAAARVYVAHCVAGHSHMAEWFVQGIAREYGSHAAECVEALAWEKMGVAGVVA